MATEKERAAAAKEAEKLEQQRWEEWKKLQEDAGFTVQGTGLHDAVVVELPEGPTFNVAVDGGNVEET
jgi:hypothetical protein